MSYGGSGSLFLDTFHPHSESSKLTMQINLTALWTSVSHSMHMKSFKHYSALLVPSFCSLCREDRLCALLQVLSAERVGQGEVGGVTRRVTCARLGPGGPILALHGCMDRPRNCYSHLVGGLFLAGKAAWALSRCLTTESADCCMLVNEWAWLRSQVCLLRLKVDLGSVLESELNRNGDLVR